MIPNTDRYKEGGHMKKTVKRECCSSLHDLNNNFVDERVRKQNLLVIKIESMYSR